MTWAEGLEKALPKIFPVLTTIKNTTINSTSTTGHGNLIPRPGIS